ncbi:hypothetical protein BDN72DRAFT_902109 [Pluteus cervinus]|uniref:Uncharacterized protein n=1 Tax=Pluteus cervinus TaxID=181527 RepID=A0ACD3ADQ2_9AGAR|nr:hypothetical protein BDN72DRAFT_902109 [Pluteus cervinus]
MESGTTFYPSPHADDDENLDEDRSKSSVWSLDSTVFFSPLVYRKRLGPRPVISFPSMALSGAAFTNFVLPLQALTPTKDAFTTRTRTPQILEPWGVTFGSGNTLILREPVRDSILIPLRQTAWTKDNDEGATLLGVGHARGRIIAKLYVLVVGMNQMDARVYTVPEAHHQSFPVVAIIYSQRSLKSENVFMPTFSKAHHREHQPLHYRTQL